MAPNQGEAPVAGLPTNVPPKANEGRLVYPSATQDTESGARAAPQVSRMQAFPSPAAKLPRPQEGAWRGPYPLHASRIAAPGELASPPAARGCGGELSGANPPRSVRAPALSEKFKQRMTSPRVQSARWNCRLPSKKELGGFCKENYILDSPKLTTPTITTIPKEGKNENLRTIYRRFLENKGATARTH